MDDSLRELEAGNCDGETVVLQWIGDVSLNGLYCDPQNHASLSANMREVSTNLGACDLRIANWEAPLWGNGGVNLLKRPAICTTRDAAQAVIPLGLDVALLANNHVYDCLEAGFENTVRFLEESGIQWLGAGRTAAEAAEPLVVTRRGLRIALLNYVGAETRPNVPDRAEIRLNLLEADRVLAEVRSLSRNADVVTVALHWGGGMQRVSYPTVGQRRFARQVIEAGAKVVACNHVHCLQGHEQWMDGHIFYGLGNFLFDGCFFGRPGVWPKKCRRVGVATTEVSRARVSRADITFLFQKNLLLTGDNTPSRRRKQECLNRSVRLSDARLARLFKRDLRIQRTLHPAYEFTQASGGLVGAFCRLRPRYVKDLLKIAIARPGVEDK